MKYFQRKKYEHIDNFLQKKFYGKVIVSNRMGNREKRLHGIKRSLIKLKIIARMLTNRNRAQGHWLRRRWHMEQLGPWQLSFFLNVLRLMLVLREKYPITWLSELILPTLATADTPSQPLNMMGGSSLQRCVPSASYIRTELFSSVTVPFLSPYNSWRVFSRGKRSFWSQSMVTLRLILLTWLWKF